jgi:hypothetical protein
MTPVTQTSDLVEPAAAPRALGCPPPASAARHRLGEPFPSGDATEDFVVEWQLTPLRADPAPRTFRRRVPSDRL